VISHTLFITGSTTKAQIAAAFSILIDESDHTLSWHMPIASIIHDDFVLSDPWATEHATVEDALSQRTGYPQHDNAYGFSNRSTKDEVRLSRHLP
jgi:CubicO group peptidase (beta-lactamase class C family)